MLFIFIILISPSVLLSQSWTISEVGETPEAITNNPVCEGYQGDTLYIYTFGGIDTSLASSGIHLRSYRYNTVNGRIDTLANMPDTLGKLGVAANRIGDIIYVVGGYYVRPNQTEVTSNKVHRFNTQTNSWMTDAADLLIATDDHVQSVWRDSLLFCITGWRNSSNIRTVQFYNPNTDSWTQSNLLPNQIEYLSFGASGTIIGDTILYYGGTNSTQFDIQNHLRMGIINPNDPTDINWTFSIPDASQFGYRMACTNVNNQAHWIGGSELSYNFDGIDYHGSGVVAPPNRNIFIENGSSYFYPETYDTIPMDLRGIGNATDSVKYLIGGMFDNQVVSNKIYKLEYIGNSVAGVEDFYADFRIYPNPVSSELRIDGLQEKFEVRLFDLMGQLVLESKNQSKINIENLNSGTYILEIKAGNQIKQTKIIKQ